MVVFASIFISFSTSALETRMKTFYEAIVDTDIVVLPISRHSVTSVTQCAMSCNVNLHCESFIICKQGEGKLLCKFFARNVWATEKKRALFIEKMISVVTEYIISGNIFLLAIFCSVYVYSIERVGKNVF